MSISASLITRDTDKISEQTTNLYESVAIIAKRARQISARQKEELNAKLAEFASTVDNLEEIFENRDDHMTTGRDGVASGENGFIHYDVLDSLDGRACIACPTSLFVNHER